MFWDIYIAEDVYNAASRAPRKAIPHTITQRGARDDDETTAAILMPLPLLQVNHNDQIRMRVIVI